MEEKNKVQSEQENCVSKEIPTELQNFKKICNSRCNICASGILKEIHKLRKDGANYDKIVKVALEVHGVKISTASLSRHFKSYVAFKTEMATEIIKNDALEEITAQSVHIKKTVELLDMAYESIKKRMKANCLKLDIGDLEKLAKMRYQILNGENTDEKDLLVLFQKATSEYGVNINQGILKL